MNNFHEAVDGVLRLFQENSSGNGEKLVDPKLASSCRMCSSLITLGGVEFSKDNTTLLLQTLLVDPKDEEGGLEGIRGPTTLCWDCSRLPSTLVDLVHQAEDLRMSINGLRRQVGRQLILGSLRKPLTTYDGWVEAVKTVEDFYPSMATKRLCRSTVNASVGTEEILKAEEEESVAIVVGVGKAITESGEQENIQDSLKLIDLSADPMGSKDEDLREGQNVNRALAKSVGSFELKRSCEGEGEDSHPTKRIKSEYAALIRQNEEGVDETLVKLEPGVVVSKDKANYIAGGLKTGSRHHHRKKVVLLPAQSADAPESCRKEVGHKCRICGKSYVLSRGLELHKKMH